MVHDRAKEKDTVPPREAATRLESLASQLRSDGPVTVESGDSAVDVDPPRFVPFSFKAQQVSTGASEAFVQQVKIDLEWDEPESQ